MTLDDLSRAAGVSKSMLSEIERDKANPTIAVAWRLTNALGVSLGFSCSRRKRRPRRSAVAGPHEIPALSGRRREIPVAACGGRLSWPANSSGTS